MNFFNALTTDSATTAISDAESSRLVALKSYNILDTTHEAFYDDIAHLAAFIFKTPIALISFIDESRQWYKAKIGVVASEIPREISFCEHTILNAHGALIVTDPQHDPRFSNNPLVTNTPKVLFYAGVPISTPKGEVLGTLCVIDTKQRQFVSQQELSALNNLARQVMAHMEISKSLTELEDCQTQLNLLTQQQTAECKEDELTHLKNRRGFEEVLAIEWERTFRHSNSLSLLLLNLDQFSRFRDEFGHAAGNEVLQKIAGLISKDARNLDLIAHFCNDDFAILLPETDSKGALIIAERIRKRIEVEHWPHRPLTASIGVSSYNGMQINEESLLSDAQQQLVQAKKAGHNCIRFID